MINSKNKVCPLEFLTQEEDLATQNLEKKTSRSPAKINQEFFPTYTVSPPPKKVRFDSYGIKIEHSSRKKIKPKHKIAFKE